MYINV